jgi:polysaccharide pyruvyl transferase WcaK-like protein
MVDVPILGWYDKRNVGDDAFKEVFEDVVLEADSTAKISYYTQRQISPGLNKIILGAGDVIRPFYIDKIPMDTSIFIIGAGLGYESEIELLGGRSVPFSLFRNKADVQIARSFGVEAEYCPDITYLIEGLEPLPIQMGEGKTLGVLLSDEINPTSDRTESTKEYLYCEYLKWELATILDYLHDYYNICFVAYSTLETINDHKVSLDIYRRMSHRDNVSFITQPLSIRQALWLMKQFELVISMKFHGIMFAVNQGVPFINIAETRKTQQFCTENQLLHLSIPRYSLEKERFLEVVKVAEAAETRHAIEATSAKLKELARRQLPRAVARFMAA